MFWWEEAKPALWVGCCARTWGFVQPLSRHLALHQTTLNLSPNLCFSEVAPSLLPSHVVVTSPLARGRCSTAVGEGQVRAENTITKPVVCQSQNFNSSFLRQVQIHNGYTLNTSRFVQFGHKVGAVGEKADMQRPLACRDTSIAAVVRVLQPGVCTGLNRSASKTACGACRAGKNTPSSSVSEHPSRSGFKDSRTSSVEDSEWQSITHQTCERDTAYSNPSRWINPLWITTHSQGNKAPQAAMLERLLTNKMGKGHHLCLKTVGIQKNI